MSAGSRRWAKVALIGFLIVFITVLHYVTDHLHLAVHIIFRELYFLPIILGGFWFGTAGGAAAAVLVTILYLPFVLALPEALSGHNFGNLVQILLFNIFGILIGVLSDRQKRQQQLLLESESLAAMGRAVSCIAHDMKTPLATIGGMVRQVRRKESDGGLAEKLDFAYAQVRRLEVLVGDMLAFARPLSLQCEQGLVNTLVEEVVRVAGEKAGQRNVVLQTELRQDLPHAEYDPHRLQQALLNLVNNALESSPPGSRVLISTGCRNESVIIRIVDSGTGIPEEIRGDIFTPFRTTKKEGTGLGLPIVRKIVDAHRGTITFADNSDRGTTFTVSIPRRREKPGAAARE